MPVGVNYETKRCIQTEWYRTGEYNISNPSDPNNIVRSGFLNLDNIVFTRVTRESSGRYSYEVKLINGETIWLIQPNFTTYPIETQPHSFFVANKNAAERLDDDLADFTPGLGGGTQVDYETKRCLLTTGVDPATGDPTGYPFYAINLNHVAFAETRVISPYQIVELHLATGDIVSVLGNNPTVGLHSFGIKNLRCYGSPNYEHMDDNPADSSP